MRHLLRVALIMPLLASMVMAAESITDFVSAELSTSKQQVYAGEPFEIFLTIRSHTITLGQEFTLDDLAADSIKILSEKPSQYPDEKHVRNNRIEEKRRFSWQAVGVATGSVELASMLDLAVLSRSTQLFFSRPKKTYFEIPTKSVTISILPLPSAGRPDNFSGAVGTFSLSVEVSPEAAAPGDVVRLHTEVSGTGLLENVSAPLLTGTTDLKLYSPKLISTSPALVYEQQISPLTAEALKLPAISFSYFDPHLRTYRLIKKGPFQLRPRSKTIAADETFRPPDATTDSKPPALPGTPVSFRNASIGLAVVILLFAATLVRSGENSKNRTRALAAILTIILLCGIAYLLVLRSGYFQRNVYKIESQQKGMAAPAASAIQVSIIPSGAHVVQLACDDGWVLISHSGRQSWIPESSLGKH